MRILFVILATFLALPSAFCADKDGLIFEPYLGVAKSNTADQSYDFKTAGISDEKFNAAYTQGLVGLRLSYVMSGLWLGLDANLYPSQTIKSGQTNLGYYTWNNVPITDETHKATRTNAGVNIGYRDDFFIWGAYYPMAQYRATTGTSSGVVVSGDKLKGTGYGGGFGYTFMDFFAVSLEYRSFKYKDDGTKASSYATGLTYNFNSTEELLVFSFPFMF